MDPLQQCHILADAEEHQMSQPLLDQTMAWFHFEFRSKQPLIVYIRFQIMLSVDH